MIFQIQLIYQLSSPENCSARCLKMFFFFFTKELSSLDVNKERIKILAKLTGEEISFQTLFFSIQHHADHRWY